MEENRRKLSKEDVAVVTAAVSTAIVLVQRFIDEHSLFLMLPGNAAAALQSSIQATSSALAKLQTVFSLTDNHQIPQFGDIFQSADDVQWRENFRMSRLNFFRLLDIVGSILTRDDDISPERKLAAALYRLAHGTTFKIVARNFEICPSVCSKSFYEVCKGLEEKLGYLFDFPTESERVSSGFALLGIPNCCGVIGFTKFDMEKPSGEMGNEYLDPKGNYNVVMQGVVDSRSRFLDISVGWPGNIPSANILLKTRFYSRVCGNHELLHGHAVDVGAGVLIPQYILGSRAYGLRHWLITPYSEGKMEMEMGKDGNLEIHMEKHGNMVDTFNKVHDNARRPLRRAFGMLKENWQLLKTKQRFSEIEVLPFVVAAACALQNFLIDSGENMPDAEECEEYAELESAGCDLYAESVRGALAGFVGQLRRSGEF